MKNPNIKTKVVHSQSKPAWNVVGEKLGGKYKIAQVPYVVSQDVEVTAKQSEEALIHAQFISDCFNSAFEKARITEMNRNSRKRTCPKCSSSAGKFASKCPFCGYTVLATVPYQLCPKCNGDGEVLVQNWNGGTTSISSGMFTCNVCGGAKIIPMHIVPTEYKIQG